MYLVASKHDGRPNDAHTQIYTDLQEARDRRDELSQFGTEFAIYVLAEIS